MIESSSMTRDLEIYQAILEANRKGCAVALATVIKTDGSTPGRIGFKMLVFEDGKILGTVGGGENETIIIREAVDAIRRAEARLKTVEYRGADASSDKPICGGSSDVFIEPILPSATLYIFGAGHVGQVLAEFAKIVGLRVVVIDDRVEFANKERFPEADEVLMTDYKKVEDKLRLLPNSYVVIVTHGHKNDLEVLKSFVERDLKYIGMIGSKKKVEEVFKTLEKDGVPERLLKKVHAPIGIDIGAETPAEIAVSIIAEIISTMRATHRSGSSEDM